MKLKSVSDSFFDILSKKLNPMSNTFHLKGLNGIRAIAALSVVITHVVQGLEMFGLPRMRGLEIAGYGVTMFFTLSGFLITYLLLLEKEKYKDVNIKQFYIRRILRIWPLYYLYLLLSLVALFIYDSQVLNGNVIFYVLLLANVPFILGVQIPVIGHFWSLGVEEQFYLFWPWVVKKSKKLFKSSFSLYSFDGDFKNRKLVLLSENWQQCSIVFYSYYQISLYGNWGFGGSAELSG